MSPTNTSTPDQFRAKDRGFALSSESKTSEATKSGKSNNIQEFPTSIAHPEYTAMTRNIQSCANPHKQISVQRTALQQAQADHATAAIAEKHPAMSSTRSDIVESAKGNITEGQFPGVNGMLTDQSNATLGKNTNGLGLAGQYPMMLYNYHPLLNQSTLGQFNQSNLPVSMINLLAQNSQQQPLFFSVEQNSDSAPGMTGMASGGYYGLMPPIAAKKKKIKGKPKRPLSAYNLFFKYERANILANIEDPKDSKDISKSADGNEDSNIRSMKEESGKETTSSDIECANVEEEKSQDKENSEKVSDFDKTGENNFRKDEIFSDKKEITKKSEEKDGNSEESLSKDVENMKDDAETFVDESSRKEKCSPKKNSKKKQRKRKIPHGKIGFENLAKIIGQRWSELDEAAIGKYKEMALQDMKRYKKEMEVFLAKQQETQEKVPRSAHQFIQNSPALDGRDGEERQLGKRKLDQVEQFDGDSLSLVTRAKHYQIQHLQHELLSQQKIQLQQQQNQQQSVFDMNNLQKNKQANTKT